jgi:hypothetical protein
MKACVVSAHFHEDLSWILNSKYPVVIYSKTITSSANHIGINKTQECPAYLKFIVENYESLPEYSIFVHGHRNSEHQDDYIDNKINGLVFDRDIIGLNRPDFYNILSDDVVEYRVEWGWVKDNWLSVFGKYIPTPEKLGFPACAQFAVNRKCIRRLPIQFWESLLKWSLDNSLENHISSRIMEYSWYYIFTGKEVVEAELVAYNGQKR